MESRLLLERDYVTFGSLLLQIRVSVICRLFVVSLSVTLVHPTQGVETFGSISSPLYSGHPLTSVQNFTEIVLGEPLRRER